MWNFSRSKNFFKQKLRIIRKKAQKVLKKNTRKKTRKKKTAKKPAKKRPAKNPKKKSPKKNAIFPNLGEKAQNRVFVPPCPPVIRPWPEPPPLRRPGLRPAPGPAGSSFAELAQELVRGGQVLPVPMPGWLVSVGLWLIGRTVQQRAGFARGIPDSVCGLVGLGVH